MARPTEYSDELLERAEFYIDEGYKEQGDAIPSIVGMSRYVERSRRSLYNYGTDHPEFLHTLERCNDEQLRVTMNGGINGEFNATIAKLVMANHGFSDKVDNTHSGPDGKPVETITRTIVKPEHSDS